MLNLSDKELDRFSKEAAQEYEPGDVLGPRSWDKLEVRMNTEFGHSGWNPLQHIRRFPFYYAPALLVLFGITYFLVRPGVSSGSSPGTVKAPIVNVPIEKAPGVPSTTEKPSTLTQNSVSTDKSTSTPSSTAAAGSSGTAGSGGVTASTGVSGSAGVRGPAVGGAAATGNANGNANDPGATTAGNMNGVRTGKTGSGRGRKGSHGLNGGRKAGPSGDDMVAVAVPNGVGSTTNAAGADRTGATTNGAATATSTSQARELTLSPIQTPHTLRKRNAINDSALRAFTLKSTAPTLVNRKGGLHINRNLQFGLMFAPDFTSVNSLAGDKPGSSFGITVDYQFANHWYLGTGILASRKNYAARNQDFHAPPSFYQMNNIGNVNFVKGSFYMMEIPLNLRYDFSVAGNTLFFISGGLSSYLMVNENANLYWNHFNIERCWNVSHPSIQNTYLCSAVNLSAGVETGLSNSLSLLIAPYVKIPTRQMGFGQVQMNSVGINFALKFAPVISRKKH